MSQDATQPVAAPVRWPSGRTSVVWSLLAAELDRAAAAGPVPLQIVDAGGGSGHFAVPIAERGHLITVVDPSPDALAALERRAAGAGVAGRIRSVQGDADDLVGVVDAGTQDVVLCHSVLEVVDDPATTVAALASALRPGGALSVIVANRNAAVLTRLLAGQLALAHRVLTDPDGRVGESDPLARRWDPEQLCAQLAAVGLVVEQVHGVRVVADLVPAGVVEGDSAALDLLARIESDVAGRSPFRDIATRLHVLARRSPGTTG